MSYATNYLIMTILTTFNITGHVILIVSGYMVQSCIYNEADIVTNDQQPGQFEKLAHDFMRTLPIHFHIQCCRPEIVQMRICVMTNAKK